MNDLNNALIPAGYLLREDYEEPCCPWNMGQDDGPPVPVRRVMEKLDSYLEQQNFAAAERHLDYWLAEADAARDISGKIAVLNEQIRLYRRLGKNREGLTAVTKALGLTDVTGADDTVTCGSVLAGIADGCRDFAQAEQAIPLYRRAKAILEAKLPENDGRLGGLYNNMALALAETGEYREAEELYRKALDVTAKQDHGEAESAIILLNMADLAYAGLGADEAERKAEEYLEKAERLLDTETLPRDGYYTLICEKCAPVFGYYGWFAAENKLAERAGRTSGRT